MSSLDSFFEPIRESTVFGNIIDHPQSLSVLEIDNADDVEAEVDGELAQINTSIQRAKQLVDENLTKYHTWKDEEREHLRLKELVETTLNDMLLRLQFIADAFTKRFPDETITSNLTEMEQKLSDAKESMLTPVQAKLNVIEKEVTTCKKTLHTLAGFVNLSRQLSSKNMCPICYNNDVDVYCDPCGHTFCQKCVKANYCYLCRTKIQKVQKLFFT